MERRACCDLLAADCVSRSPAVELRVSAFRASLLTATARLIAQVEAIATTTIAGTRSALGLQRFGHFNGVVKCIAGPVHRLRAIKGRQGFAAG